MAHFAKLDENNIVTKVIVVDNNDLKKKAFWDPLGLFTGKEEIENVGISFCQKHWEATYGEKNTVWRQTSYNARLGTGFRGSGAGIGMIYMTGVRTLGVASTDIFMNSTLPPEPSWSIGLQTARYCPPGPPGWPIEPTEEEIKLDPNLNNISWEWDEDEYNRAIKNGDDVSTAWVMNKRANWKSSRLE